MHGGGINTNASVQKLLKRSIISGIHSKVDENCAVLGYCVAGSVNLTNETCD
jgi:hypothetical protein